MTGALTLHERIRLGFDLREHFGEVKRGAVSLPTVSAKSVKRYHIGPRSQTLVEWAREYRINPKTVRMRLKRGLPLIEALTRPLFACSDAPRTLAFNGRTQTLQQWATELDLSMYGLMQRLNNPSWTLEKALTRPRNKRSKATLTGGYQPTSHDAPGTGVGRHALERGQSTISTETESGESR